MGTLPGGFTLNILLEPLLIFGVELGIAGAALATILSQLAALAAYAVYFGRGWGVAWVRAPSVRPSLASLRCSPSAFRRP